MAVTTDGVPSAPASSDGPWLGDACSLVDAFRAGERSPAEELQATLDAIAASDLNCFSFLDPERALAAARQGALRARPSYWKEVRGIWSSV